jgi:antitoxin MazE
MKQTLKTRMVKWGNSLALRLPKPLLAEAKLREGDWLEIRVVGGKIELRRLEKTPTLAELVAQITRENRYPEIASGPALGREAVEW